MIPAASGCSATSVHRSTPKFPGRDYQTRRRAISIVNNFTRRFAASSDGPARPGILRVRASQPNVLQSSCMLRFSCPRLSGHTSFRWIGSRWKTTQKDRPRICATFAFTDDPFSEPSRAPNPSALSWTIAGDEEHEYEVPDRSNYFSFKAAEIENALGERWNRLEAVSNRSTEVGAKFSSLTKHFFVKVFADEGIDELVSGLTCVEATLMLREWKGRERMIERCQNLLHNDTALNRLRDAYDLRDKYLHGLGDQGDTTAWEELAKYRCAVAKAVDNYLTLAGTSSGEDRDTLLRLLKR
jgi:hypothetical protein